MVSVSFVTSAVIIVFTRLLFRCHVNALGRHNFECPDGFYLNSLNSMFGGDHRMYSFGCAPLANRELNHEKCQPGKVSASSSSDMYMSCENYQYVAGISIVEDSKQQLWTLLCCHSTEISIDEACTSTTFLNEYKKNFAFASGAKHVLRKWQSVYDLQNNDRRWWLQTCPFTIVDALNNTSKTSRSMNFRRKVKFPFEENRIEEIEEESNEINDNGTFVISQNSLDVDPVIEKILNTSSYALSSFNKTSNVTTALKVSLSPLSYLSSRKVSSSPTPTLSSSTLATGAASTSTVGNAKTIVIDSGALRTTRKVENNNNYDDYYEPSGSARKKSKPPSESNSNGGGGSSSSPQVDGIFKELHKVFKNIQDGLVLAQWVLSSSNDNKKQSNSGDKIQTAKTQNVAEKGNESNRQSDALLPNEDDSRTTVNGVAASDKPKTVFQSFAEFVGLCPSGRRSW